MRWTLILFFLLGTFKVFAATTNREDSLRQAVVWSRPPWMDARFRFDPRLDMLAGPAARDEDRFLDQDVADCRMNEKNATRETSGMTRKFFCRFEIPGADHRDVKIKYSFRDGEIAGEILGTRLLWALGFGSDQMFLIQKLRCFGCTESPHDDRRVDSSTLQSPRIFDRALAESKLPGKEIKIKTKDETREGWTFQELMRLLPSDPKLRVNAQIQREALKLFAVFVRHADNKSENQRLICLGDKDDNGGCSGRTAMYIQDLGVSFGKGTVSDGIMSKVVYADWDQAPVWRDPKNCVALLGDNAEGEMEEPVIHEEGRVFFVQLLKGFSGGPEGRRRVEDLFRSAHAEDRMGTIEQWTKTFLRKVNELENPLGSQHKDFQCPKKFR